MHVETLLRTLADVAVLKGRTADARALREAAGRLATGDEPQDSAVVREALAALREAGAVETPRVALADVPVDLQRLVDVAGLSVAEAAQVHARTGAISAGDMAHALESGALHDLPDCAERVQHALPLLRAARRLTPLGRTRALLEPFADVIRDADPLVVDVALTGSARRYADYVGDLELLAATPDPAQTASRLATLPVGTPLVHAGPSPLVLRLERLEVIVRLVHPDAWIASLVHLTGSPGHVAGLAARAAARGLRFRRDGLTRSGLVLPLADETAFYKTLDLPFIPPELREGTGELEAAERGELPVLVSVDDIRGDLHMHTDWSDGRDSIDAMVGAAEALGYEYVAVTDHSASALIARGLDRERLARQRDAIEAVRDAHPEITVLHGSEVDILAGGSLDFPDDVLEGLDIVLASLHDPGDDDGARLTRRYVAAMRHPLVQIVTHPTNRLVPGRDGYDLDEGRLFAGAVETGTILEIDGAPSHLDMDGPMARRAVRAGVTVSIDSDCHRAAWLGLQMQLGVATARRGWIEARHVANARPLRELRTLLARKRAGRTA